MYYQTLKLFSVKVSPSLEIFLPTPLHTGRIALLCLWKRRLAFENSNYNDSVAQLATANLSTIGLVPELGNASLCPLQKHFTPTLS